MSDLQQAVERLRRIKADIARAGYYYPASIYPNGGYHEDLQILADAYLSQHAAPGDDGELRVDREWALSLPGVHQEYSHRSDDVWIQAGEHFVHWRALSGEVVMQPSASARIRGMVRFINATRRELRSLLDVLGK